VHKAAGSTSAGVSLPVRRPFFDNLKSPSAMSCQPSAQESSCALRLCVFARDPARHKRTKQDKMEVPFARDGFSIPYNVAPTDRFRGAKLPNCVAYLWGPLQWRHKATSGQTRSYVPQAGRIAFQNAKIPERHAYFVISVRPQGLLMALVCSDLGLPAK